MMKRLSAIIPAVFLFFTACGGGDSAPPSPLTPTNAPLVTPEALEADRKLREALDKFKQGLTDPNSDKKNWEALVVATLLWKSAPLKDGSLAINNPFYRDIYLPKLFKGFANQTVSQFNINPSNQALLLQRYTSGFNNQFLPRLSGQISSSQLSQLQSAVNGGL